MNWGAGFLNRLFWPLVTAAVILLVYLAVSRLVLPRRYKKEELFLARRLGRMPPSCSFAP